MDYSVITNYLLIGTTPRTEAYPVLRELGVKLVINMRWERRPFPDHHNPPLPALWLPTFDNPLIPIPVHVLQRGARSAIKEIESGGGIYVHCQMGRHRGVAMGAAVLIACGFTAGEAMHLIKRRRPVADPDAWYIKRQILKFEQAWKQELKSSGDLFEGIGDSAV